MLYSGSIRERTERAERERKHVSNNLIRIEEITSNWENKLEAYHFFNA